MAGNLVRPKNVTDAQWQQAVELYNAAKRKGDRYPELTVAQAALETGWFKSSSGRYNYFGQKAKASEKASTLSTREVSQGREYTTSARFKDYNSIDEAVADRVKKWGSKYKDASTIDQAIGSIWQYDPKTGSGEGYATDSNYGYKLKTILNSMGVSSSQSNNPVAVEEEQETSTYKPYVSYLQENAGTIETAGKYSEPKEVTEAKKEIYQAQQEENFLEALSNLQQQPQQTAPQQEQSYLENPELFQLAQVPQIQYEQFQKGGKVVYGTPEYEAAYNRGEVITDEGVRSPIQLDEVVVQNNYRRPRGFWEQYKDKIVEENKDAGVLGAIIGTPISAVASLPQLAMMKVMTGEMQRPSEAWGFSSNEEDSKVTKYGKIASNFVMDAVADPANLVGAGLLTKEKALAGLTASKESGLLSKTYKLNPWAFKPNTEMGIDNLGDNLNTINNQLPDPEPFISLDINSSRSFNLSRAKRDSKNIYKETLEEGNLRVSKRGGTPENPKTITVKTKSGAIQATQNPDGSYMFHNAVDSRIDAGKAMLKLNEHLPKRPTIFETSSMSTDSYTNLLKIGKSKDWKASFEGFSPLNDSNKNVNFLDDLLKWKNRGANAAFSSEKNAVEAQRRMNAYLSKQGYDRSANIIQRHGEWQMEVPNYRVQRNYQKGGEIELQDNERAFLEEYFQDGGVIEEDKKWLENWYNNRVIPDKEIQEDYLKDKPYFTQRIKEIPSVKNVDIIDNDPFRKGRYDGNKNTIEIIKTAEPSTYLHEANHSINSFPSYMRTVHENIVDKNIYKKGDPRLGVNNKIYDYLRDPDEIHSRVQVLRKDAGFRPDEEITEDRLYNYLQNYKGSDSNILQLMNLTDDKGLLDMLNYMAYNPKKNSAKENYAESGGIIKDNNGYWNPNNWGKTVEIASPNITMKGVKQPLVGYAPETGETKIMLPGEDYFFNGANRVIESQLIK